MSGKTTQNFPRVSIVTVVYNGKEYLEKTIRSVIAQTYPNIEYIVIDGGSTDGTIDLIKKYEKHIDYWTSEPDEGIYDAMNKAIKAATGEWLTFLNGNDSYYNDDILNNIFFTQNTNAYDFIYGDFCIVGQDNAPIRTIRAETFNKSSIKKGMIVNHQSLFIRREKTPFYNLNYRYKAEWNWLIDILYKKEVTKILYVGFPIVYYKLGGFSQQGFNDNFKEFLFIMKERFGIGQIAKNSLHLCRIFFGFHLRKLLKVDTLRRK